jgi:hypothetical protein
LKVGEFYGQGGFGLIAHELVVFLSSFFEDMFLDTRRYSVCIWLKICFSLD